MGAEDSTGEEVDSSVLTTHERAVLKLLRRQVAERDERVLPSRFHGGFPWGATAATLAIGTGAIALASSQAEDEAARYFWSLVRNGGIISLLLAAFVLVGGVVGVFRKRRAFDAVVLDFLKQIKYDARLEHAKRREGRSQDNDDSPKSRRQMQHEWYGDHRELDWRDRTTAEVFGMDADTYVSNFLENDKD